MYCKICGNLLNKDEKICKACGSEIVLKPSGGYVKIVEPAKENGFIEKVMPDVIFNPPYSEEDKNERSYTERKKESRIGRPDTGEFAWNVQDFPKTINVAKEKTEEARFNWSNEEIEEITKIQKEARERAKADFRSRTQPYKVEASPEIEIKSFDASRYSEQGSTIQMPKQQAWRQEEPKQEEPKQEEPVQKVQIRNMSNLQETLQQEDDEIITKRDLERATISEFNAKGIEASDSNDKFFTFSKKNEEFQRLLDKEYARISGDEEVQSSVRSAPLMPETPVVSVEPVYMKPTVILDKPMQEDVFPESRQPFSNEETVAKERFYKNISEEEIVLDNDTIKQRHDTLEVRRNEIEHLNSESDSILKSEYGISEEIEPKKVFPNNSMEPKKELANENVETIMLDAEKTGIKQEAYPYFEEVEKKEEPQKSGIVAKIVLVVIILLLIAELVILGVKYFLPDSEATAFILQQEIFIVETISSWISKFKEIF